MDKDYLFSAIHNIALWAIGNEDKSQEVQHALELIESICRHSAPIWTGVEARKYGIATEIAEDA